MGLGVGTVHRPRHRPARRNAGRGRPDPLRRERSPRAVRERSRPDGLQPHARGTRHGYRPVQPAPADQHQQQRDRCQPDLWRDGRAPGLAQGAQRVRPLPPERRPPPLFRQARRSGDGPDGAAHGRPERCDRRRRRTRQREHGPDVDPDALRARAQPHRGRATRQAQSGDALPDRAARRRRRDPVHHLQGVPAGDGRLAAVVLRLQAKCQSIGLERVRDRRASAPTAWCTESSSRQSRGDKFSASPDCGARRSRHEGRAERRLHRHDCHSARHRIRQSRPGGEVRPRPAPREPR